MTSLVGGMTSAANANNQADLYGQNAENQRQTAQTEGQVGAANEDTQRRLNAQKMGEQRASLIDSGTGTSGTSADILQQSAQSTEMDALNTRYASILKARGYRVAAAQSEQMRNNAIDSGMNSMYGAGASALGQMWSM